MDRAAIYADSIASLVNAYSAARLVKDLSDKVIASDHNDGLNEIRQWLGSIRESGAYRERMELALMLREVAERGDAERTLCRELLDSILRFSENKSGGNYWTY
jgi:hypothetical protein